MGLAPAPGEAAGHEAEAVREGVDGGARGGGERGEQLAARGLGADAAWAREWHRRGYAHCEEAHKQKNGGTGG